MRQAAFNSLTRLLAPQLPHDYRATVTTRNAIQTTVRYLAGAPASEIRRVAGVLQASFSIHPPPHSQGHQHGTPSTSSLPDSSTGLECVANGFTCLSMNDVMNGCVGCLDGRLCEIQAPRQSQCEGAGPRRFYSGRYRWFGASMQSVCDAECRFTYVSVLCPGSVSDLVAYEESALSVKVESLPSGVYLLADSAYVASDHLLTPFAGKALTAQVDAFNFYLSQLRMSVEMAFGMLVSKWQVFKRPLESHLQSVPDISALPFGCVEETPRSLSLSRSLSPGVPLLMLTAKHESWQTNKYGRVARMVEPMPEWCGGSVRVTGERQGQ
ncbi:hypothetical protein PybrP1_007805 [[Pythium] brassicae (nom. inval.)]|nr:hypothetical protein PybrP1_007805 [[Pythium] brassicae (nom. inval.)]